MMRHRWFWSAPAAALGCLVGGYQAVQEDGPGWAAEHATAATRLAEILGGGMVGAALAALAAAYWISLGGGASRRAAIRPTRRTPPAAPVRTDPVPSPARAGRLHARHGMILLFAVCLLTGGVVILVASLAHPNVYGILRGGAVGAFLIGLGGFLLWDDLIVKLLRHKQMVP
jgi:hypothetical protein